MLFLNILAALAFSNVVVASPHPQVSEAPTEAPTITDAPTTTANATVTATATTTVATPVQSCPAGEVGRCCDEVGELPELAPVFSGLVGINCISIPVGGCSSQAACCSGNQTTIGLINVVVDLDCVPIL